MSLPLLPVVALALAFAYLAGSIPFAFLFARFNGVDIRKVGSGNVGATNVFRAVGKGWGVLTFTCDVLKGLLPALALPWAARALTGAPLSGDGLALGCGAAAIAGHTWPVWLRFKGGKGVATTAGVLLGVAPLAALFGLVVWALIFFPTRYVSLASVGAAAAVPLAAWVRAYWSRLYTLPVAMSLLGLLIVYRHRANLRRLRNGTEPRAGRGAKSAGVNA